jgi:DNA-binding CsgD family transcriptional regulator
MEDEQFRILLKKLDTLTRLMALSVSRGLSFREQVRLLSSAGLPPKEIAAVLGKSGPNVRVTLSGLRKAKRQD